jgi:hypothetical protein
MLADMAKTRMCSKPPQLTRALDGRFGADHTAALRGLVDRIDWLDVAICVLDPRVVALSANHAKVITPGADHPRGQAAHR